MTVAALSQNVWNVAGILLMALTAFLVLRWLIGRKLRWRRRVMELHTVERAMLALGGTFPRRRRFGKYGSATSLADTPFADGWTEPGTCPVCGLYDCPPGDCQD